MLLSADCRLAIYKYLSQNQELELLVSKFCQNRSGNYGSLGPAYTGDSTDLSQFTAEKMVEKAQDKTQKLKLLLQTFGFDCIVNQSKVGSTNDCSYYCTINIVHKAMATDELLKQLKLYY
jgi:hypothetical protein